MAFPNFKFEAAFGSTDPFSATAAMVDLSTRLKSVQWQKERQREFDAVSPATATVWLDNSDRALEAMNVGSIYYPNVRSDVRCKLSVSIGGAGYQPQFVMYVDDFATDWMNQNDDVIGISLVDAQSLLNLIDVQGLFPQQAISSRVGALLDYAGWPTTERVISSSGTNSVPQQTFVFADNADVYSQLQAASDARPGALYIDNSGKVVSSGFATPAGALPSTLGLGGIDFTVAQLRQPRTSCYNVWKMQSQSPSPALTSTQQDSTSIGEHRRRVQSKSVLCMTQAQLDSIGASYLSRFKWPRETFDQLGFFPTTDAGYSLMAAVDIGSTGLLVRHSDVGSDYSQNIIVNGFSHSVDIGNHIWSSTWRAVARQVT